jgi:DNA-binding beta-propeller fold protein YncE
VLTVDPKHRIVEGIASDGSTIWVSSILDRQILACRTTCRTLATLPAGLYPFAIAWDSDRKRLWVAADCPPGVAGIKPCDRGALLGLDTRGRIQTRISPGAGTFHPGDVSASGGRVFVSDSQNGLVFQLMPTGRALMAANLPGDGKSAQGTALTPDGKLLVVADYSKGIGLIDLATFKTSWLLRQDGKPLRGIDGIVRCGSVYYGIYNGASPGLLVSIARTDQGVQFEQPLGGTTLPDPTQVAYDGKRLLIVADSGWATIDTPDFKRTAGAPIVAIPLSADCKPQ